MRLSAAQTDKFTIASLESRITTDTYNIHNFVSMMQRMGVRAPILLIGGIAITLIMDSYLALTMIALLPLLFVTVMFISKKGVPLYTKVQKSVDRMIRVVREDAQGIRVIKALSKSEYEHRRYDKVNRALVSDEKRAGDGNRIHAVFHAYFDGDDVGHTHFHDVYQKLRICAAYRGSHRDRAGFDCQKSG